MSGEASTVDRPKEGNRAVLQTLALWPAVLCVGMMIYLFVGQHQFDTDKSKRATLAPALVFSIVMVILTIVLSPVIAKRLTRHVQETIWTVAHFLFWFLVARWMRHQWPLAFVVMFGWELFETGMGAALEETNVNKSWDIFINSVGYLLGNLFWDWVDRHGWR